MKYTIKDLPSASEIHSKLRSVKNSTSAQLDVLKAFLLDKSEILVTILDDFLSAAEYVEDPEVVTDSLLLYHLLVGGMLGLAVAIERQAQYIPYKELTEDSRTPDTKDKKSKLTQMDRKEYAKGEAADMEGLVQMLEKYDRNLLERIQIQKGNFKKSW
jgi:hypothetical protein